MSEAVSDKMLVPVDPAVMAARAEEAARVLSTLAHGWRCATCWTARSRSGGWQSWSG